MRTNFSLLFLVFIIFTLTACATSVGSNVSGRVIDAETNQPLPNVAVAIKWEGPLVVFPDSQITCVGVDSELTDADGQYRFWPWIKPTNPLIGRIEHHIAFHKYGYERKKFKPFRIITKKEQHKMVPFNGSIEERMKQLMLLSSYTSCYGHGEEKTLLFLRSLYAEANEIATNKDDLYFVNVLLKEIEAIEFGEDEANRRWGARQKELESKARRDIKMIESPNPSVGGVPVPVEPVEPVEPVDYSVGTD
jgi:hypothetical protein